MWKWKIEYFLVERDFKEPTLHNTKSGALFQEEWEKKNEKK